MKKPLNITENGQELDPNFGGIYYGKGLVYSAKGQYAEAIANFREMIKFSGNITGVQCYLGFALAKSGQISEAQAILQQLETGTEYVSPVELAILYVGLNSPDKALTALERAVSEQDSQLQFLGIEPHFDSLRTNARFIEIIRQVGF